MDIALKKECMKQIAVVADVNKFKTTKGRSSHQKESRRKGNYQHQFKSRTINVNKLSSCFTCSKSNHKYNNSKYKLYNYTIYNIVGHLAVVCKKK